MLHCAFSVAFCSLKKTKKKTEIMNVKKLLLRSKQNYTFKIFVLLVFFNTIKSLRYCNKRYSLLSMSFLIILKHCHKN